MNGLRLDGRCILGAFLVLLPAAFLPAARAQQDMSAAIERVNGSVFTIKAGQAVGTGFVVNPAGEALTCKHAVGEASQVEVTLANGESAKAQVVARDETQDLALLKLEKAGLPAVVFAPAADLKPGQRVAAVGALLGLKNSVTEGVVSALDREIGGHKYFQIDAALNSGSSGGPVVNSRGEVVGVATAVVKEAGNVGFALPSETALEFLRARNVAVSTALRTEGGEPPTVAPGPAPPASPTPVPSPLPPPPTQAPRAWPILALALLISLVVSLFVSLLVNRAFLRRGPQPGPPPPARPAIQEDLSDIDITLQ